MPKTHPLIQQTKELMDKASIDHYGLLKPPYHQSCLDLHVSRESLQRALHILNEFIVAIEKRGFHLEVAKMDRTATWIIIRKQKVKIRLLERVRRIDTRETKDERSNPSLSALTNAIFTPTGKLVFVIDEYISGRGPKMWPDTPRRPLKKQLNDIIVGIISIAEAMRLRALEWKNEERKRAEKEQQLKEERRKSEEENQWQTIFEQQADLWFKSQNLRAFIQAFEKIIVARSNTITPGGSGYQFLKWAKNYADQIDPLKNGYIEKVIGHTVDKI